MLAGRCGQIFDDDFLRRMQESASRLGLSSATLKLLSVLLSEAEFERSVGAILSVQNDSYISLDNLTSTEKNAQSVTPNMASNVSSTHDSIDDFSEDDGDGETGGVISKRGRFLPPEREYLRPPLNRQLFYICLHRRHISGMDLPK